MKKSLSNTQSSNSYHNNREAEYRKINSELEARAAEVIKATDAALIKNENLHSNSSSSLKSYKDYEERDDIFIDVSDKLKVHSSGSSKLKSSKPYNNMQQSLNKSLRKSLNSSMSLSSDKNLFDDYEDVMPAVANEMSDEAQIRFLKANLKVMKQDMDILVKERHSKDEAGRDMQLKFKEADEERQRLQRSNISQNSQIEKLKKQLDEYKEKATNLEIQLTSIRKESDNLQKNEKLKQTSKGTVEVKLNKALEECEKYKTQLEKLKANQKDNESVDKKQIDELISENKKLEKQKAELLNAFKKQLKLIDVYKRLQMHMEASRMLAFTEDEFMRALEWHTTDNDNTQEQVK